MTWGGFSKHALTKFHKIYNNADSIDDYETGCNEDSPPREMSTAGFINWVGSGGNIANKHNNGEGAIEWYTPSEYVEAARKANGWHRSRSGEQRSCSKDS